MKQSNELQQILIDERGTYKDSRKAYEMENTALRISVKELEDEIKSCKHGFIQIFAEIENSTSNDNQLSLSFDI
jgi:hypothetical protein